MDYESFLERLKHEINHSRNQFNMEVLIFDHPEMFRRPETVEKINEWYLESANQTNVNFQPIYYYFYFPEISSVIMPETIAISVINAQDNTLLKIIYQICKHQQIDHVLFIKYTPTEFIESYLDDPDTNYDMRILIQMYILYILQLKDRSKDSGSLVIEEFERLFRFVIRNFSEDESLLTTLLDHVENPYIYHYLYNEFKDKPTRAIIRQKILTNKLEAVKSNNARNKKKNLVMDSISTSLYEVENGRYNRMIKEYRAATEELRYIERRIKQVESEIQPQVSDLFHRLAQMSISEPSGSQATPQPYNIDDAYD